MGYISYLKRPSTFNPNDWKEICSFVASLMVFWWNKLMETDGPVPDWIYNMPLELRLLARELISDRTDSEKIQFIAKKWNDAQHIYIPFYERDWWSNDDWDCILSIRRSTSDNLYTIKKYGNLNFIKTNREKNIDNLSNAIFCFFHRYVYGCTFLSDSFILNVEEPEKMKFDENWLNGYKLFLDWEKEYRIKEQIGKVQIGAPKQRQEEKNNTL